MVTFQVSDMTCGHCASAIFRAVASVDKDARVDIRIQQKLVRIDSSAAPATHRRKFGRSRPSRLSSERQPAAVADADAVQERPPRTNPARVFWPQAPAAPPERA